MYCCFPAGETNRLRRRRLREGHTACTPCFFEADSTKAQIVPRIVQTLLDLTLQKQIDRCQSAASVFCLFRRTPAITADVGHREGQKYVDLLCPPYQNPARH